MSSLRSLDFPEESRDLLESFVADLTKKWKTDIHSLVLFGSAARGDFIAGRSNLNILIIVQSMSVAVLQRAGSLHRQWGKHQIVAPLLMNQGEIGGFCRSFPLEFLQMSQAHVLLAGQEPFKELLIDASSLARQCEQELQVNLLRIRQCFIEGEGRKEAVQTILMLSITAVLSCIRGLLYLAGKPTKGKDLEILEDLPGTLHFDPTTFVEILRMKRGLSSPGSLEWINVYERYLQNLERFIEHIQYQHDETYE